MEDVDIGYARLQSQRSHVAFYEEGLFLSLQPMAPATKLLLLGGQRMHLLKGLPVRSYTGRSDTGDSVLFDCYFLKRSPMAKFSSSPRNLGTAKVQVSVSAACDL